MQSPGDGEPKAGSEVTNVYTLSHLAHHVSYPNGFAKSLAERSILGVNVTSELLDETRGSGYSIPALNSSLTATRSIQRLSSAVSGSEKEF